MFSWICPRCGRENRASDTECVNCKLQEQAEPVLERQPVEQFEQQVVEQPVFEQPTRPVIHREQFRSVPNAQAMEPPPMQQPRQANPLQAPLQHAPPPRRPAPVPYPPAHPAGLPTWLMIPLFAFAFIGLGAALYFGFQRLGSGKAGFTGGEIPAATPKPKGTNALQTYVEVVGIRLAQDARKKPLAKFVAVNHGSAPLDDLTANVTLWASTSRSEEDSVGTFTFKINSLGANEAKEITTPLKTKLKVYELPDWQLITADVQITSP